MRAPDNTMRSAADIPDKLYFRIGDVARICEVEPYVLRFWETEFPQLKPGKSGTGQRLYRRREVEFALRVKTLLHDQGYTIAGARLALKGSKEEKQQQNEFSFSRNRADRQKLDAIRAELADLLLTLSGGARPAQRVVPPRRIRAVPNPVSKMPSPELF